MAKPICRSYLRTVSSRSHARFIDVSSKDPVRFFRDSSGRLLGACAGAIDDGDNEEGDSDDGVEEDWNGRHSEQRVHARICNESRLP